MCNTSEERKFKVKNQEAINTALSIYTINKPSQWREAVPLRSNYTHHTAGLQILINFLNPHFEP